MGSPSKVTPLRSAAAPAITCGVDRPQIDAELQALESQGLEGLRLQWRNRWGRLAPAHLSRALLFRLMAYRMQAEAFGDLDNQIARWLDRLAQQADHRTSGAIGVADGANPAGGSPRKTKGSETSLVLRPGALLIRECQGRIERVMALDEGFAWSGKTFASLSAVAFAITGVKWNGHRFFFGSKGRGGLEGGKAATIKRRKPSRRPTLSPEATP